MVALLGWLSARRLKALTTWRTIHERKPGRENTGPRPVTWLTTAGTPVRFAAKDP